MPLPAGLTEELSRRQTGVEVMFRIGDLALQGLETVAFIEQVLGLIGQSIKSDAALVLLRDEQGAFSSQPAGRESAGDRAAGVTAAVVRGGGRRRPSGDVRRHHAPGGPRSDGRRHPRCGTQHGHRVPRPRGRHGGFLPDERELLLGYAQTTAVALQKLILRENVERNLVDTITAFVNAIESKDRYLKGHSARVALYAAEIAQTMG